MKVLLRLDLSKLSDEKVQVLYKEQIISKHEFLAELKERGCHEWLAIQLSRHIESTRAA